MFSAAREPRCAVCHSVSSLFILLVPGATGLDSVFIVKVKVLLMLFGQTCIAALTVTGVIRVHRVSVEPVRYRCKHEAAEISLFEVVCSH